MSDDEEYRIEWSEDESDVYEGDSDLEDELDPSRISKRKSRGAGGRRRRNQEPTYSASVNEKLMKASEAYTRYEYEDAIKHASDAIAEDPSCTAAYQLLMTIYNDQGDSVKALQAQIISLYSKRGADFEGWIDAAEKSRQFGFNGQALKLYSMALRFKRNHIPTMLSLAALYGEMGIKSKCLRYFNQCTILSPGDMKLVLAYAEALVQFKETRSAVNLYESCLARAKKQRAHEQNKANGNFDEDDEDASVNEDNSDEDGNKKDESAITYNFDWSELNVLSELYIKVGTFSKAIRVIKSTARWINGREDEDWWDDVANDAEFDSRRFEVKRFQRSLHKDDPTLYEMPIDIRYKLLTSRIKQKDNADIEAHLQFLKAADPLVYNDLYIEGGFILQKENFTSQALELFKTVLPYTNQSALGVLYEHIGQCYYDKEDLEQAEESFKCSLDYEKGNINSLVGLAEIYDMTGRTEEAAELIKQIYDAWQRRSDLTESAQSRQKKDQSAEMEQDETNSFQLIKTHYKPSRLTPAERAEAERESFNFVQHNYEELMKHKPGMLAGSVLSTFEYARAARSLIDVFISIKQFFPQDKKKVFKGFTGRRQDRGIEGRLEEEQEDEEDGSDDNEEQQIRRIEMLSKRRYESDINAGDIQASTFRGISFDDWFEIFIQYALILPVDKQLDVVYKILERVRACNVFYQDRAKMELADNVEMSAAFRAHDYARTGMSVRKLTTSHQFNDDGYRLFQLMFTSGLRSAKEFALPANAKYILRQVKAMDSVLQRQHIPGGAKVLNQKATHTPYLYLLYGQMMLVSGSYVPGLTYLVKTESMDPAWASEPLAKLLAGTAYIHRAIQRHSTNRHLQILQGMSYLFEYFDVRKEQSCEREMEANFNIGRAFHMLGLGSLAVPYYQKVLESAGESYLKQHAAYNLYLIYTLSGNGVSVRDVLERYLTI